MRRRTPAEVVAPSRRPIMTDVAKLAGVSQTTVSLVLNEVVGVRISDGARRRVTEAAAALGYRIAPRGSGRLRTVGFLVDELSTSPFAAISVDGARDAALEENALLLIASARGEKQLEDAILDLWLSQGLAGIIYARIFTRRIDPPHQLGKVPSVLLNCHAADNALPSVVPADGRGGETATRHLIAAGHRRIGLVTGEPWMEAARDRTAGYRRALREAGLPVRAELIREGNWTQPSGRACTHELMRLAEPPTAIFCANDLMAQGCYDALNELGRKVPADVSVVGYDNRLIAQLLDPPLTTLDLPHAEMGRWASLHLLRAPAPEPRTVRMECKLVQRHSVANLAG